MLKLLDERDGLWEEVNVAIMYYKYARFSIKRISSKTVGEMSTKIIAKEQNLLTNLRNSNTLLILFVLMNLI